MPPNSYSQNSNGMNGNQYASNGYGKTKLRKLLLIAIAVVTTIAFIALIIHFSHPDNQQSKDIKSATAAAKKQTPHAKVTEVKVADGFAVAIVSDPTAKGQANSGNQTYFKVNEDGSMTQIANGSSFNPVALSGLGIPLSTQAKLSGRALTQAQQDLAATCSYGGGNEPGYIGFDGSFNPGEWQIDAGTFDGLEQVLTTVISNKNAQADNGKKIICVNATREKSNATTDRQTYISAFTLELQFITGSGTVATHSFTFAVGPNHYHSYTLDGQKIQA